MIKKASQPPREKVSLAAEGAASAKALSQERAFNMGKIRKWTVRPDKPVSGEQELEDIIRGVGMQTFCQKKESRFNSIDYRNHGRIFSQ